MLKINDKIIDVYTTEIKYSNSQYNSDFGYSPVITIEYEQENKRGYISFFLDFHEELNFNMLTNKEYIDNPSDINSKISMLEIYDTKDFIDYVDSSVLVSVTVCSTISIFLTLPVISTYLPPDFFLS